MNTTDAYRECPAMPLLIEWFDGTLDDDAGGRVEKHLDSCGACRQSLLDWSERVSATAAPEVLSAECPDSETLVAYCVATLDARNAAEVEIHLRGCARCLQAAQHVMRLQRQMERKSSAGSAPFAVRLFFGRRPTPRAGQRRLKPAATEGPRVLARGMLAPAAWPRATLAAAAMLVLAIGVTRFVLPSRDIQQMHGRSGEHAATVEITSDTAGRARPAMDEPVVEHIARGTRAQWLETSGKWTRIELADGRRVWVEKQMVMKIHR